MGGGHQRISQGCSDQPPPPPLGLFRPATTANRVVQTSHHHHQDCSDQPPPPLGLFRTATTTTRVVHNSQHLHQGCSDQPPPLGLFRPATTPRAVQTSLHHEIGQGFSDYTPLLHWLGMLRRVTPQDRQGLFRRESNPGLASAVQTCLYHEIAQGCSESTFSKNKLRLLTLLLCYDSYYIIILIPQNCSPFQASLCIKRTHFKLRQFEKHYTDYRFIDIHILHEERAVQVKKQGKYTYIPVKYRTLYILWLRKIPTHQEFTAYVGVYLSTYKPQEGLNTSTAA